MSATNYTPIQIYRTTTSGAAPVAGNLAAGELAININDADMALYAKNNSGTVKRLINNPVGLKYPTADGTVGQVIKTDGAGNMSFVSATLKTSATGSSILPSGTTGERDGSPVAGYFRFNTTNSAFEGYNGSAWAGVGKVLQVVQGSTSTQVTSSSTTYSDTGLTATITPTSASSKILVIVHQNGCGKQNIDTCLNLQLLRNSSHINTFGYLVAYADTNNMIIGSCSTAYLDAPATTSATTYKTQFNSVMGVDPLFATRVQWGSVPTSTITLMEIGA